MMQLNIKRAASTLLLVLFLAGCTSTPSVWQEDGVRLEGIDSNTARINRLYLQPANGAILLRGDVTRYIHAHGQIPGHLHIELISAQGKTVGEADIGYSRQNSNSHDGSFELALPAPIPAGSTIRVTHHDPVSHLPEPVENPWHEVNDSE
jgi:hypothetical protein